MVLGIAMVNYPAATTYANHDDKRSLNRQPDVTQKPIATSFWTLQAAAKSLTYLPIMERAITLKNPDIAPEASLFAEAEVRLTGVGPLTIGMTLEEATDALGIPVVPLGSNVSGECTYYQPDTVAQALGLMVVDNRVIRVDVWPGSSLATVSGIAIGMNEADLKEQYPGQIEEAPNTYTAGKILTFVPEDPELSIYRLVFETDAQGQIVQYRAGQFPAVTWPDGCI
jgi:hypothetical protein